MYNKLETLNCSEFRIAGFSFVFMTINFHDPEIML